MSGNYGDRIVKGFAVVFILTVAGSLIGYVLRLFLSRNLTPGDFGLFYAILAFLGLFSLFSEAGLGRALVKYIPNYRVKNKLGKIKAAILISTGIQLLITICIVLVIIFFSDWLAVNYFHNLGAPLPLLVLSMSFVVSILMKNAEKIFQGFGKMKLYGLMEPLRIIVVLIMVLFFVTWGVFGVALAYLLGAVFTSFISIFLFFKIFPFFKIRCDSKDVTKKLFKFGFPVIFTGLSGTIMMYSDTILITFFRTVEEVGYYQAALPTARFLIFFSGALSIVLFPMFSEMWARKEKEMMTRIISILTKIIFIVIIPGLLVFLAFPEIIIRTLFSNDYVAGAIVLQFIAVESVFLSIIHILSPALSGMGKPEIIAKATGVIAVLDLILNILLIPVIGIVGAAISTLFAEGLLLGILIRNIKKEINVKFNKKIISKIIVGGLVTLGLITFLKEIMQIDPPLIEAVVVVIPAFMFYMFFVIYMKVVTKGDLKIIKSTNIKLPKKLVKIMENILRE
jgi:O-antigen/teichoic acid export membrane protein